MQTTKKRNSPQKDKPKRKKNYLQLLLFVLEYYEEEILFLKSENGNKNRLLNRIDSNYLLRCIHVLRKSMEKEYFLEDLDFVMKPALKAKMPIEDILKELY